MIDSVICDLRKDLSLVLNDFFRDQNTVGCTFWHWPIRWLRLAGTLANICEVFAHLGDHTKVDKFRIQIIPTEKLTLQNVQTFLETLSLIRNLLKLQINNEVFWIE